MYVYLFIGYFFLISSLIWGCDEKKIPETELLIGSWHKKYKNIYEIYTFRANQSFVVQIRIEGQYSKIIEKKESVNGTWKLEEKQLATWTLKKKQLTLTTVKAMKIGNWKKDVPKVFIITDITKKKLLLSDADGKLKEMDRVRSEAAKVEDKTHLATIDLGPIVVNLKKQRPDVKDRYLCISIECMLASSKNSKETVLELHPRVQEIIIFHLSSLTYKNVNSLKKIDAVREEISKLIKPYIEKEIKSLKIKNVIITAKQKAVEDFLNGAISVVGETAPEDSSKPNE